MISNLDGAVNSGHKQTDLIIMNLANVFDKVPHRGAGGGGGLFHKLEYFGIGESIHRWINSRLSGSTRQEVIGGHALGHVPVLSGVPQ